MSPPLRNQTMNITTCGGFCCCSYKCLFSSKLIVFFYNATRSLCSLLPSVQVKKAISPPGTNLISSVSHLLIWYDMSILILILDLYSNICRYRHAFYSHLLLHRTTLGLFSSVKVVCRSEAVSEETLFGGWRIHWEILMSFSSASWSTGLLFREFAEGAAKTLFLVLPGVLILEDVCSLSLFTLGQNLMASSKRISFPNRSAFTLGLLLGEEGP